ncbi:MAG: relaxase domain-containing protein, partial [Azospirillum sp.]|nr:relaxase domain-containing protein [Azospirillum sp.]
RRASKYPENEHELGFAARVEAVANYYGGGAAGEVPHDRFSERVLKELGLERGVPISAEQRAHLLLGRSADGARQLAQARDRKVSGYDLTFSVDKSVSILWALSDDAQRAKIELVVRRANAAAMALVEREIGWVRRGAGGSAGSQKVDLIYSSHSHFTARPTESKPDPNLKGADAIPDAEIRAARRDAGLPEGQFRFDPQLHCHNQVMSMARAPDGKWLTIDTKLLHGVVHYCGTIFEAEIARGLRELGRKTVETNGFAEVKGFEDDVRKHFSARTVQAEENARDYAKHRGEDFDSMPPERKIELIKAGSHASRLAKGREEDPEAHFEAWKSEAAAFGVDDAAIAAIWRGGKAPEKLTREQMIERAADVALGKLAGLLTREALIDGRKFRDIAAHALVQFSKLKETDIEAVMRRAAEKPITVHGVETNIRMFRNGDGEIKFTTQAQLDGERRLLEICEAAPTTHTVDFDSVAHRFDPERPPNEGQLKAIRAIAEGGDITVVEGAAGVGKTTLLQAPVAEHKSRGYTVIGLSIANRTAKALADAGIDEPKCLSIEAFVQGIERGQIQLQRNTLVIIDEFSQVDIRRGTAVFDAVQQAGGKLVALGDEYQAAAIDAGSAMRLSKSALERNVIEVTKTVRQQGEAAEIAAAFRKGGEGVAEAVEKKIKNGDFVYTEGGREASISRIIDQWVALRGLDGKCSISAPTNHDVLSISRGMRGKLREVGRLGEDIAKLPVVDTAGNEASLDLARGDKIMFLKRVDGVDPRTDARRIAGYNGSVVELLDVDLQREQMRVKTANDVVLDIKFKNFQDRESGRAMLGYGYALTIDKAQGITSDNHINALLGGTAAIDAKKFYVNESRHRHRCVTMLDREAELENLRRKLAIGVKLPDDPREALVEYSVKNIEKCALKMNALDFVEAGGVEHMQAAEFARAL